MRVITAAENPDVKAPEIMSLLGRKWQALSLDDKAGYIDAVLNVKRSAKQQRSRTHGRAAEPHRRGDGHKNDNDDEDDQNHNDIIAKIADVSQRGHLWRFGLPPLLSVVPRGATGMNPAIANRRILFEYPPFHSLVVGE
jgi:hypothetical protein